MIRAPAPKINGPLIQFVVPAEYDRVIEDCGRGLEPEPGARASDSAISWLVIRTQHARGPARASQLCQLDGGCTRLARRNFVVRISREYRSLLAIDISQQNYAPLEHDFKRTNVYARVCLYLRVIKVQP